MQHQLVDKRKFANTYTIHRILNTLHKYIMYIHTCLITLLYNSPAIKTLNLHGRACSSNGRRLRRHSAHPVEFVNALCSTKTTQIDTVSSLAKQRQSSSARLTSAQQTPRAVARYCCGTLLLSSAVKAGPNINHGDLRGGVIARRRVERLRQWLVRRPRAGHGCHFILNLERPRSWDASC